MKKKLNLQLVGTDGNAFMILGLFRREAKRAGWSKEEIEKVTEEATSGDYNHLIGVILEQ